MCIYIYMCIYMRWEEWSERRKNRERAKHREKIARLPSTERRRGGGRCPRQRHTHSRQKKSIQNNHTHSCRGEKETGGRVDTDMHTRKKSNTQSQTITYTCTLTQHKHTNIHKNTPYTRTHTPRPFAEEKEAWPKEQRVQVVPNRRTSSPKPQNQ